MAFNGPTKFPKISTQNYTNILYSDSDSDSIPDLKLPPVKGKKLKRRKGGLSGKQNNSLCNMCVVLKLISAVVVFLALTVLTSTCFWTVRQIIELQEQVAAYENPDKVVAEILKLQKQLAEVNTSVMDVKAGLSQTTITLTDFQTKLEKLEEDNKKLQQSTSASNELPSKVQLLVENLSVMGKDITQMKNTSFLLGVDFENRLRELEAAVKDKGVSSGTTGDKQDLVALNESLVLEMKSLRQVLDQQTTRVKVLEDFTMSQTNESSHDQDVVWVTDLVNKLLQEKGLPATSQVDNGKFPVLGADIFENMQEINSTLYTLNNELDAVSSRLDGHDRALEDLTEVIRHMKNSGGNHSDSVTSTSPTSRSEEFISESTSAANNSLQNESVTEPNQTRAVLHIGGINTREDLHNAFAKWPVEKGLIDIDNLNAIGSFMLDIDALKPFDADGDDLFTEDELAEALGFHHNPR
jgi:predicted  nucleic acid-binding Zn-ribbon protein